MRRVRAGEGEGEGEVWEQDSRRTGAVGSSVSSWYGSR